MPFEPVAHMIINVGAFPTLIASALLVWFGWRKIAATRLAEHGGAPGPVPGRWLAALLHDPVKFGMLWQMVYMNIVVTAVGIFFAIRLDEQIRTWSLPR